METLESWWNTLTTYEMVYWFIAIPASVAFLITLVSTFMGFDSDSDLADVDTEIDGDAGIGFQFFTLKNLIGFFTIFAWTGLGCSELGINPLVTALIALLAGLAMMFIMSSIFFFMSKLTHSGTMNIDNAIGVLAEVYLTVPAERGGFGKVQLNIQGQIRELDAITDAADELGTGSIVVVKSIIDQHILLVEKSQA